MKRVSMSDRVESKDKYEWDERRLHRRFKKRFTLYIDEKGGSNIATAENISAEGLYLHTHTPLDEGALLTLHIPRGKDNLIVARARVVHSNPGHGAGLRFHGLSQDDRALLEDLLEEL
jgi:PilZ domain